MVLWLLSLVACTSKFNCDSWAAILILSKAHVVLHKVSLFFWWPFYNFRSPNLTLNKVDDDVDDYDSGRDADINLGDNSDDNGDDDDDDESNGNKLLSLYYYESDNDNGVVY